MAPHHSHSRPPLPLLLATTVLLLGATGLVTVAAQGPITLTSVTVSWAAMFLAALTAVGAWWTGYLQLHRRLAPEDSPSLAWLLWPLAALTPALLLDFVVVLSGKLSYVIVFDEPTFRTFRYLSAGILGASVFIQEVVLLRAVHAGHSGRPTRWSAPGKQASVNRLSAVRVQTVLGIISLASMLLLGARFRLDTLDVYHAGDMDVILSITYNMLLGWPPVTYYHGYSSQTWVYNHLPLFPLTLAPLYWIFENILFLPTVWAAKCLLAIADMAIAVLLYFSARGKWNIPLGLALAASWLLPSWVIRSNDHPISFAVVFVLLALRFVHRPWMCGLMLALGVASRNEVAFLALPMMVHFAWKRPLDQAVSFFAVSGTVLMLIALPFVLYDPAAMDYAMRRQLQRDASGTASMFLSVLNPFLSQDLATFLRHNPSLPALALAAVAALPALCDTRVERVTLLVSLVYLINLPLVYERYTLFAFALGLYYASRFSKPILAGVVLLMGWSGFEYAPHLLLALLAYVAFATVFRPMTDPISQDSAAR